MTIENLILIRSETRLERLLQRFNTLANARFYLERQGQAANLEDMQAEDRHIKGCVEELHRQFHGQAKVKVLERQYLPTYLFTPLDLVLVVGQDGLVANTAKYALDRPIIGVNPDPGRYDGVLLPFGLDTAKKTVERILLGRSFTVNDVALAEALLDDGQRLLAFNDLFIGPQRHSSARYLIRYGERQERQSSSGIIVSTGAGSTGWLSSLFNMTNGMGQAFGDTCWPGLDPLQWSWDLEQLVFAVREPFLSRTSSAEITVGRIDARHPLVLESHMPEEGIIFSDGIQQDFLQFTTGRRATIGVAPEKARLVVG